MKIFNPMMIRCRHPSTPFFHQQEWSKQPDHTGHRAHDGNIALTLKSIIHCALNCQEPGTCPILEDPDGWLRPTPPPPPIPLSTRFPTPLIQQEGHRHRSDILAYWQFRSAQFLQMVNRWMSEIRAELSSLKLKGSFKDPNKKRELWQLVVESERPAV